MVNSARRALLAWYSRHARDLPWRRTRDPYRIWISEIMLQQTQVRTVQPRYEEFIARYPSVEALASATEQQVCEAWAGLGYYRRARHLHAAARVLVSEHGGRLPETVRELRSLPGIGRYSAGAIASIAFGQQAPVVDGNVARVLSRLHAVNATDAQLWQMADELVRGERPGDLNQAVMELGATVCSPSTPDCPRCPVHKWCRARAAGEPTVFPEAATAPERKPLLVAYAWIERRGRGLWLRRRPLDGLWAGLWEPLGATGRDAKRQLAQSLGVELGRPVATVRHDLSHRRVTARVYAPHQTPQMRKTADIRWFAEPMEAPLSALAKRAIRAVSRKER